MTLTFFAIHAAQPRSKPYKLADRQGLYLFVAASSTKSRRFKFDFGGKERLLTFGRVRGYIRAFINRAKGERLVGLEALHEVDDIRDALKPTPRARRIPAFSVRPAEEMSTSSATIRENPPISSYGFAVDLQ